MTERLPVPSPQQPPAIPQPEPPQPLPPRRPISVAFLPLALVAFVVLVFIAAAWTFFATTGG
jgi:hypothetical protein